MGFARYSRDEAAERVPRLVGDGPEAETVLACLGQALTLANDVEPALWAMTLLEGQIRLTFGPVEVFRVQAHHVWFAAADLGATALPDAVERSPSPYKSQPGAEAIYVPREAAAETFGRARDAFRRVLEQLATRSTRNLNAAARTAHARGLVDYLEERVGPLPRPAWDVGATSDEAGLVLEAAAIASSQEGRRRLILHFKIERSPELVRAAKALWRSRDPMLRCEACDFSFVETFRTEYIQAHHRLPLEKLEGKSTDNTVDDLAPVCANCHVMIHQLDCLDLADLRRRLHEPGGRLPRSEVS